MLYPQLTKALQKIALFVGLTDDEVENLICGCSAREVATNETLFLDGAKSDAIYFLIAGELEIFSNGIQISSVKNQGVVGEMGALTGLPRSATVISKGVSRVLFMTPKQLESLIELDTSMGIKLYRNATKILSEYVSSQNHKI